jgi:hypothetical protein
MAESSSYYAEELWDKPEEIFAQSVASSKETLKSFANFVQDRAKADEHYAQVGDDYGVFFLSFFLSFFSFFFFFFFFFFFLPAHHTQNSAQNSAHHQWGLFMFFLLKININLLPPLQPVQAMSKIVKDLVNWNACGTTRQAFLQFRAQTEQMAKAQFDGSNTTLAQVVGPLNAMREEKKNASRKFVAEGQKIVKELAAARAAHEKLKQRYTNKCMETEQTQNEARSMGKDPNTPPKQLAQISNKVKKLIVEEEKLTREYRSVLQGKARQQQRSCRNFFFFFFFFLFFFLFLSSCF